MEVRRSACSGESVGPQAAAIDLTRIVRPGDTVIWGQACAEPRTLTRALAEQRGGIGPIQCFLGITLPGAYQPAATDDVRWIAYGGGGVTRDLDAAGALGIVPSRYSDLAAQFARGTLPVDVAFVQVTPGETAGTYRFALAAEYLVAAARAARAVVVEVNELAPRSPDAPVLYASEVTAAVHAAYPPAEQPAVAGAPVDRLIARYVADLVEDGATLQIGIGSLPEAIVRGLSAHRDLGVHSGAIGDAVAELAESGAITNARKDRDRGKTVCGVLIGTSRLFSFADGNHDVALRETGYTHDAAVLAGQPRLVTINAAVEVDLTGQVNSEVAGARYLGAVGGCLDFTRAAHLSDGGLPVVALRSTAAGASTIVARLSGPVTIPRSDAGIVITEYGAADLRGLSLARRRERLLEITHPRYRDSLAAAAPGPGEIRTIERSAGL
jgi:acetyl-CoA hydrolase